LLLIWEFPGKLSNPKYGYKNNNLFTTMLPKHSNKPKYSKKPYYHNKDTKKEKKAGAIIFDSKKEYILLIKGNYSKKWGVPKGTAEFEESMYVTANREVYEETGIQLGIDKYEIPVKFGRYYLYVTRLDMQTHEKPTPIDIHEIADIEWVALDSVNDLSDTTVLLKKVMYYIKKHLS
jgi:8-oxo-dGTP pyrophosphatase MutT (NUDIX family)